MSSCRGAETMNTVEINGCRFDIIPIIKGLISEKEKVLDALSKGNYDAAAVALGPEDIEAITKRAEIKGEYETSDLDIIYSRHIIDFGPIDMPDPASTVLIDECNAKHVPVLPLDMSDAEYTEIYCNNVTTIEFLKEKRIIRKALRKKFDKSTPENFVMQWDALMNKIKGYDKVSKIREAYMADQIKDIAKYKKCVLTAIEYERVDGVLSLIS